MKRNRDSISAIQLAIGAGFLGWAVGTNTDRDSTAWWIGFTLLGLWLLASLIYTIWMAKIGADLERESVEAAAKAEDLMDELRPTLLRMFPPRSRRLAKEFRTLTGEEATKEVKERAFEKYVAEMEGTADLWNAQPEFARETWYKDVEEEDAENDVAGTVTNFQGDNLMTQCRKIHPHEDRSGEYAWCERALGHDGAHWDGKRYWNDDIYDKPINGDKSLYKPFPGDEDTEGK